MDIEGQKLRDTFLWNKNESMLAPEQFAEVRTHFQGEGGVFIFKERGVFIFKEGGCIYFQVEGGGIY